MLAGVVDGKGHVAVSPVVRHGQRPVIADASDGPGVSVADGLTAGCGEPPVVAACRHDITDVGVFAAGDPCRRVGVEVTGVEPGLLHGAVDGVDVVVCRRHQCRRASVLVIGEPGVGHTLQVVREGAGDDAAVRLVGVEGTRVTGSHQQRRGCLPWMLEAVQAFELIDPPVGAQLVEQAAAADTLQLAGITDERQPPLVRRDQPHDSVEVGRGEHPGLIDDERGPRAEPVLVEWWPIGALPLVEQLGDSVGADPGVALEVASGSGGRRQPEHPADHGRAGRCRPR